MNEKRLQVNLSTVESVKNFVAAATKLDCDIDLVSGHYVIDAKSIMGIFSLNLSRPIDMQIHAHDGCPAEKVMETLKPFLV